MAPHRALLLSLMCAALAACGDGIKKDAATTARPSASAAPARASASAAASATSAAASATSAAASATSAGPAAAPSRAADERGGEGDCKLSRGPVRLSTTGAVAIGLGEGGLLAFATNKLGAPFWEAPRFPEPVKPGASSLLPRAGAAPSVPFAAPGGSAATSAGSAAASGAPAVSAAAGASAAPEEERVKLPACALAGGFTFCVDAEGSIHRIAASGEDKIVAKGRKATPVTAAALDGHTFYAFLAYQKTTEGVIARAFAAVDDETPIPLSEEGSGATYVGLVPRERDVLAMYIDARTALTPVHARTLRAEGHLARGPDAVVFMGGGADGHVRGAVGRAATGPALLFIPGDHDKDYGVVTLAIDGEPKDDLPGNWSHYPTSMVSPWLAATIGKSPLRLVRSRPETSEGSTPQVLELGHVDADGTFREKCVLAKSSKFSDVAVAVDDKGSLWVVYTNKDGTWVEQRSSP